MPQLHLYSSPWCSDCRVLKRFLESEGIPFEEILINEKPEAADELVATTGKRGIPFMRVGEVWVKGYPMDPVGFRTRLTELGVIV